VVESVFNFLFEQYWRVHVEGAERVPNGPAVLIANHVGALPLDGAIVTIGLRRARPDLLEPRWLAEEQLLNFPILGGSLFELGAVPASFQNGLRLLNEGRAVLVFPEGTRGLSKPIFDRYQLKRFGRGGFLKLAVEASASIVPVGVIGGEEAMPSLAKLPGVLGLPYVPLTIPPLPTRWTIRFGAPLDLNLKGSDLEGEALQGQIDVVRHSVEGLVKSLRAGRQSLFW
jgi:1-acyl-sn-glycerol-3-phosphate acyltransferase